MKRIIYFLITIVMLSGCNIKDKVYSRDLSYMDTFINIKVYSDNDKLVEKAMNEIDKMYQEYDELCNRYQERDGIINIKYINEKLEIDKEQVIDKRLYDILKYSKSYYEQTNGLFNIALGNVLDVWKKYRDGEKVGIPTLDELKQSGSIDLSTLVLLDNNTIKKTSNISIDLGGIAKGYVTEIAGDYLESIGLNKYLITAGTSSIKAGKHYNNGKYRIGLIDPKDTSNQYKVLIGNNISITTSGSYERYYEYQGVRYHHIIDPNTLFPTNRMLSVTVITNDAALGEVLSKTLFLMPISEGMNYIKSFDGVEAIWYGADGEITTSIGMKDYE